MPQKVVGDNTNQGEALAKINKALTTWTATKDTLNEANTLKYKGYLLGLLYDFKDAK
jgi:hypothetical protein